jgi:putative transposase
MKVKKCVFIDETGLNREQRRLLARAKRGVTIHATKSGKRTRRVNIIGGLVYGEAAERYIAVQCYEHSTTGAFFEDWFEFELIPVLPENALVIMDNASFHRKGALYKIASRYGVGLLFLPPYSPDFNPIEHSWANFKKWWSYKWWSYNFWRFPIFDFAVDYSFGILPILN